jgi:glycine reductase
VHLSNAVLEREQTSTGLRLCVHRVSELALGTATSYGNGTLTLDPDELAALAMHPALGEVRVSCASPGDSARIVKVLDAVEPRTKRPGEGSVFPGILTPVRVGGPGETHVLRGAAVVSAGFLPRAQEGVVQMCGGAAELSPLSRTHNVVVEFTPSIDAEWPHVEAALRLGLLRIAVRLAEAALAEPPDDVEQLDMRPTTAGRPRVAAVTNLQTQGAFKDVLVYGRSLTGALPTLIEPGELAAGAVVSAQYGHPGLKNPTYVHQNNPVVAALQALDGVELAGVVLSPEPVSEDEKRLVSDHAARLCVAIGADAAIVTKEGGGNADADVAMKMDALEERGIAAVGLFAEMAGRDGTAPPLVAAPSHANAMVSTGNYDEPVLVERVDRAFGGERVEIADANATAELELPIAAIYGSLNPLGWGRLTCAEGL